MTLSELPTDIILDVVKFLEMPDPLSLLLTCSAMYGLSHERSFWISILQTTRNKYPIACPLHDDLSKYTLEALKGLIVLWMKLRNNWNQPRPQTVRPMTFARLPAPARILLNVQGTDILVLNMEGKIFCWDAKLSTPFLFPAIETGGKVTCVSGPFEALGVCSLAVEIIASHSGRTYVITIAHEDKKAIGFTSQFLVHKSRYRETLFLTGDVVGSISREHNQNHIITFGAASGDNRHAEFTTVLKPHHSGYSDYALVSSFAYKGHLYHLYNDGLSARIQHISQKCLRSGHLEESGVYNFAINSSYDEFLDYFFIIPSTPVYGVCAVLVRVEWNDYGVESRVTSFTFMPNALTHASDDGESSPLAFDSPCVTEHVLGRIVGLTPLVKGLVAVDSGLNVAAVIQSEPPNSEPPKLVLVRYHLETRSTSVHTLTVPDTINLFYLDSLCVDDAAGAIHLLDKSGVLWTLRYI
ncbi:F-box domain-containing protein [Mycena venus]|uniref:F-box domain-containing protein n=1 Tax=Mycena venus TaxID=2733690 RepID=A0A8H6TU07_9AGAR|nr:F-box domain-containing protein [Mycena venus]